MARNTANGPRHPYEPDYAVRPGDTVSETIESLGIDQKEFAERTGFTQKHISQVINGAAPITPEAAIRFELVTGVPARMWNSLETQYQEQKARLEAKDKLKSGLEWLKTIPHDELAKRNVIPRTNDKAETLEYVLRFFGVASVEAWDTGWANHRFAFRKSTTFASKDGAMAAWLRLGELEAHAIDCGPFDNKAFRTALGAIRGLTNLRPEVFSQRMVELCATAGVAVAIVPEIKGARVNGAAKWITPSKAMIALSLRGKWNDRFWFTFFHEAGHLLNDGKKEVFVDVDHSDDPREKEANEFACQLLIPAKHDSRLLSLKDAASVRAFAKEIGIHPGIVVGRLQHDRKDWGWLNSLRVKLEWPHRPI